MNGSRERDPGGKEEIMSYYPTITITCARCGKQHEYSTKKKTEREAEWWKGWAEDHYKYCPDCEYQAYKEKKDSERDERIRVFMGSYTLPELKGTPKQIAWAERLRAERIDESARIGQKLGETVSKVYGQWLASADSAKDWIELSKLNHDDYLREVKRRIGGK